MPWGASTAEPTVVVTLRTPGTALATDFTVVTTVSVTAETVGAGDTGTAGSGTGTTGTSCALAPVESRSARIT